MHFMNWNKKWDRWFEAAGLKALDDEEVHAAVGGDVQKKRIMGVAAAGSAEEAAAAQSVREEEQNRKRRRKALAAKELVGGVVVVLLWLVRDVLMQCVVQCEEEEAANSKLPIPFTLKKLLVDEWEVRDQSGQECVCFNCVAQVPKHPHHAAVILPDCHKTPNPAGQVAATALRSRSFVRFS